MVSRALTVGVIAERLAVPVHRVEYLLRVRDIAPVQRAGQLRIFSEAVVQTLERELAKSRRGDSEREHPKADRKQEVSRCSA